MPCTHRTRADHPPGSAPSSAPSATTKLRRASARSTSGHRDEVVGSSGWRSAHPARTRAA